MLPLQANHPPGVDLPVAPLQHPVSELTHRPVSESVHLAGVRNARGVVCAAGDLFDFGMNRGVRSVLNEGADDSRGLEAFGAETVSELTLEKEGALSGLLFLLTICVLGVSILRQKQEVELKEQAGAT